DPTIPRTRTARTTSAQSTPDAGNANGNTRTRRTIAASPSAVVTTSPAARSSGRSTTRQTKFTATPTATARFTRVSTRTKSWVRKGRAAQPGQTFTATSRAASPATANAWPTAPLL